MSDVPDVQDAKVRPRGRHVRLKALAVLALSVLAVLAYLWFPRPKPDYIRLPAAHGPVEVKTWLTLPSYRQFYVKTRIPRPWQSVLQELGRAQDAVRNHINWKRQSETMPDSAENLWRSSVAMQHARPLRHGGYGDPLPPSYVVFVDDGPDETETQHHKLFYRLTAHSGTETTLEVWDNLFFNP